MKIIQLASALILVRVVWNRMVRAAAVTLTGTDGDHSPTVTGPDAPQWISENRVTGDAPCD